MVEGEKCLMSEKKRIFEKFIHSSHKNNEFSFEIEVVIVYDGQDTEDSFQDMSLRVAANHVLNLCKFYIRLNYMDERENADLRHLNIDLGNITPGELIKALNTLDNFIPSSHVAQFDFGKKIGNLAQLVWGWWLNNHVSCFIDPDTMKFTSEKLLKNIQSRENDDYKVDSDFGGLLGMQEVRW